jgi:ribosome biogenesis protein MAK21
MAGPHKGSSDHGSKKAFGKKNGGNNFNNRNNNNNNKGNYKGNSKDTSEAAEPISEVKKAFATVVKGPSAKGSIPKSMLSMGKPAKVKLTFKPSPQWYGHELAELEEDDMDHHINETTLTQKTNQAKRLLEEENTKYDENPNLSSSDKNFVSTIMSSGTLNDRVSALTLIVQESPIHTTKSFDKLMSMAEKKNRTEAVKSIESLKDLFIGGILPDRKLKYGEKTSAYPLCYSFGRHFRQLT